MLYSEQGGKFESELWSEMCYCLAICKTRTNPWRPQSNRQVERFNRTLIQVLKPLVNSEMIGMSNASSWFMLATVQCMLPPVAPLICWYLEKI